MKRFFTILAISLAASLVSLEFVACSDDDDTDTYTVTYVTEVGVAPAAITVDEGTVLSEAQLPTLNFSDYGYTFEGWYVNTPPTAQDWYDGGQEVVAGKYAVTGDVELGASWTHTVMLDPNGGSGSSGTFQAPVPRPYSFKNKASRDTIDSTADSFVIIPTASDCGISKDGYTFVCWNDKEDGTGTSFRAGESNFTPYSRKYVSSKTSRLYAVWEKSSPTLKIATANTVETVLPNLKDGDTLIYLGYTPNIDNEETGGTSAIASYLQNADALITLDLSYHIGNFKVNGSEGLFQNCSSIKKLILGHCYGQYLPDSTFKNCGNLSEVLFNAGTSDDITEIGSYAFTSCSIKTLTLPAKLERIRSCAFSMNRQLKNVILPASLIYIKASVFDDSFNLETVTFENTVGWRINGTAIDVSNPVTNATKLNNPRDWGDKEFYHPN